VPTRTLRTCVTQGGCSSPAASGCPCSAAAPPSVCVCVCVGQRERICQGLPLRQVSEPPPDPPVTCASCPTWAWAGQGRAGHGRVGRGWVAAAGHASRAKRHRDKSVRPALSARARVLCTSRQGLLGRGALRRGPLPHHMGPLRSRILGMRRQAGVESGAARSTISVACEREECSGGDRDRLAGSLAAGSLGWRRLELGQGALK
jgi:hypothetical protein